MNADDRRTPIAPKDPRRDIGVSPIPRAPLPKFGPTPQQIQDSIVDLTTQVSLCVDRVTHLQGAVLEVARKQEQHSIKLRRAAGDSQKFEKVDTQLAEALVAMEERLQSVEKVSQFIAVDNAKQTVNTHSAAMAANGAASAASTLLDQNKTDRIKAWATIIAAVVAAISALSTWHPWDLKKEAAAPSTLIVPHAP